MEIANDHSFSQAARNHQLFQLRREDYVVAQYQDRLTHCLGKLLAAVTQYECLTRTGDTVNNSMSIAQASSQLFLLQIHDVQQSIAYGLVSDGGLCRSEQAAL